MLITLILVSSIVLFGQAPGSNRDSLICYTKKEAKTISLRLIDCKENQNIIDAVYIPAISAKDTIISSLNRELIKQENRYSSCERLVKEKEIENDAVLKEMKKERRKRKWMKFGWVSTAVLETALILFFAIK